MKKIFTVLGIAAAAFMANAQIVISEVYGGGGGNGATYINDYVELKNIGTATATISGASLQYASSTGTFNSYSELPTITLEPNQKYLIEMIPSKANSSGLALPTADFLLNSNTNFNGTVYTGGFNMAAGAGKVALAKDRTQVTAADGANVLDFVGYGSATMFEGSGPAPAIDATSSATRTGGDTNNNSVDFVKAAPTPENKATSLANHEVNGKKIILVKNTTVDQSLTFGAKADVKIYTVNGQLVKATSVNDGTDLNISGLAQGVYIVTGEVNGQKVSQKIIKK